MKRIKYIIVKMLSSMTFKLFAETVFVLFLACLVLYKFNLHEVPDMLPDVDTLPIGVDSRSANSIDHVENEAIQNSQFDSSEKHLPNAEASNPSENTKYSDVLLFTTMFMSEEKVSVLDKLFQLWKSWIPQVKPLVFTSDPETEKEAKNYDWPYLPEKKNPACYGPPLFPDMFIDAIENYDSKFYCYANSDIVFDNGFLQTIKAIEKNKTLIDQPFMLVGKRIYFDFVKYGDLLQTGDDVGKYAGMGEEIHWSSDYWVTTKLFPWHEVLPVSVGRPLFCRWIIAYAIEKKMPVIDTSLTIKAVHLTTQDGNRSSWDKPGNDCNARIIMYGTPQVKQMRIGLVECADLETYFDTDGEIKIRSRKPDEKECPAYYKPDLPAVWFKAWNLSLPKK